MHRSFITRLKNEANRNIASNEQLRSVEVNLKVDGCNTASAVSTRILSMVFEELIKSGVDIAGKPTFTTLKKVLQSLPARTILFVIYIQEASVNDNVEKLKKYKEGIAAFTKDATALSVSPDNSLLFCICLEAKVKNDLTTIVSSTRGIKRLPALSDISTGDVEHWLAHHKIEENYNKVQKILDSVFKKGATELPLSQIETELENIIHAYNSKIS